MNIMQSVGNGIGGFFGSMAASYYSAVAKAADDWAELKGIWNSVLGSASGNRKQTPIQQLREFQSWIYVIITTIYGRTSTVPWNLKISRPDNTYDLLKNQYDHPMYKLLIKPNPFMTGTFMQQYIQAQLDLTGMAFIWKINNRLNRPAELWPLNVSEFVDFIPGKSNKDYLVGYKFNNMEFTKDEIIYIYYPNPDPSYFSTLSSHQQLKMFASIAGMSPIQAMAKSVDIEKYIEIYERDFFENSARPDIILTPNDGVRFDEEKRNRILTNWKQKHKGPRKFWEPTVLSGMTAEVLKTSNRDFEFYKLASWTKDMLFAAYSVPEGKAGLVKDVNRANAIGIDITFNQECIKPRLNLWDESFTNQLAIHFDEKLVLQHDNPIPSDKEFVLKQEEFDTKNYVRSINEIREGRGLQPVAWGDRPWMPITLLQPSDDRLPANQQEEVEESALNVVSKNWLEDEDKRTAYWKAFDARARKHEKPWIKTMTKLFKQQERVVLENLNRVSSRIESQFNGWSKQKIAQYIKKNAGLIDEIVFDLDGQTQMFGVAGKPLIKAVMADGGESMLASLGVDIAFDLESPWARNFIEGRTNMFSSQVVGTTHDELRKTLQEGFSNGENINQLRNRIKETYNTKYDYGAQRIARTETISASNAGSLEGMKQSGVVDKKEWISSKDDRVRDSHLPPLDGQVVDLNKEFTSNSGNAAQFPGGFGIASEDIQCRCTVAAVIETK